MLAFFSYKRKRALRGGGTGGRTCCGRKRSGGWAAGTPASGALPKITELKFEELQLGRKLAAGGSGQTFAAQYEGHPCCAKELFAQMMQPEEIDELMHEVAMLSVLRHPCIVFYWGWCGEVDASGAQGRSFILMELAAGSLADYLQQALGAAKDTKDTKDSVDPVLLTIALQVAEALHYLHSKNIVHRDVKPQNVLLMSMEPRDLTAANVHAKLCDFGISRRHWNGRVQMTMGIGTPHYLAPEMRAGDARYDESVDVYSFGIMLNVLLSREEPFAHMSLADVLRNDIEARPNIGKFVPPQLRELVRQCWAQKPDGRPSMLDVIKTLGSFADRENALSDVPRNSALVDTRNIRQTLDRPTLDLIDGNHGHDHCTRTVEPLAAHQ